MTNWAFTETDQAVARDLRNFLPERMFDAHAHGGPSLQGIDVL